MRRNYLTEWLLAFLQNVPAIHLAVTSILSPSICAPINLMEDQSTAAIIWQPQNEVTDLSFAPPGEEIINSMLPDQVLLLSRLVKTKQDLGPK